jgi:hypothetical protein
MASTQLKEMGACVIPLRNPRERINGLRYQFEEECRAFPEYVPLCDEATFNPTFMYDSGHNGRRKVKRPRHCNYFQLGSFGAMSNPGSFHNRLVRNLRYEIAQELYPLFQSTYDNHIYCQALFDRMSLRPIGTSIKGESAHRDIGPVQSDEWILQGYLNLNHTPQFFSFVPGSHLDEECTHHGQHGFVKTSTTNEARMKDHGVKLQVDPGHLVLFYQTLLHEVCPVNVTQEHSMRLHIGFFFSPRPRGLFESITEQAMQWQGLPRLPSGQVPPVYSKMHMSALRYKIVYPWSDACVRDFVKTMDHNKRLICPRTLENVYLAKGASSSYPPYTETEKSIMRPQQLLLL